MFSLAPLLLSVRWSTVSSVLLSVLWCGAFAVPIADAQFTQIGPKTIGSGASFGSGQGQSVAISRDGETAIVGGPFDSVGVRGASWIYIKSGGVWVQQGPKLVGTGWLGSSLQGWSVAISADGNTALVGGTADSGYVGAAWVFTRSGGVWTQQGGKLRGAGFIGPSQQGSSVALSDDGNTALIGGAADSTNYGAIWVFTRSAGVWTEQARMVPTGGLGPYAGCAVSLSGDGNTALVGGLSDSSFHGAAWVFTRSGTVWSQQGGKLVGTGGIGAVQGISVSISQDGNTAAVGGQADSGNVGAVWIFTRSAGVWTQQGSKLLPVGASGLLQFGSAVSLSSDGNKALIGAKLDSSNVGATRVFTRSGGVWTQQGSKLVGTGGVGGSNQGRSVSLSGDGLSAVVGGSGDYSGSGAVWFFGATAVEVEGSVNGGWTIVSVPVTPEDFSKTAIYPDAGSEAWAYDGSAYTDEETLENGRGYWIRFDSAASVSYFGAELTEDSITVEEGWTIVGSLSAPVDVSTIGSNPGGIVTSQFYGYDSGYHAVTTLEPGRGYWVKVSQDGALLTSTTQAAPVAARIRIMDRGELPPAPPDAPSSGGSAGSGGGEIPLEYRLDQNYPNPFNPSTSIAYAVPVDGLVTIRIFDMLGREVTTLVREVMSAGSHRVEWRAEILPSGIYLCRLEAEGVDIARKLVLMK